MEDKALLQILVDMLAYYKHQAKSVARTKAIARAEAETL